MLISNDCPELCISKLIEGVDKVNVFVHGENTSEEVNDEKKIDNLLSKHGNGALYRVYGKKLTLFDLILYMYINKLIIDSNFNVFCNSYIKSILQK